MSKILAQTQLPENDVVPIKILNKLFDTLKNTALCNFKPKLSKTDEINDEVSVKIKKKFENYSRLSIKKKIFPKKVKIFKYNHNKILETNGFKIKSIIVNTLQGFVAKLLVLSTNEIAIVKATEIFLHKNKIGIIDGKGYPVNENIKKETKIMRKIQKLNPPKGFLKVLAFLKDTKHYFLVMEYGGEDFFDWVSDNHKRIENKSLSIKEWKRHTRVLFSQIVEIVYFLHKKAFCCHLDISLENMLIKGARFNSKTGKFDSDGQINFCDFGVAKFFSPSGNKEDFLCKKYVGKVEYQAPEVYKKKKF